MSNENKMSKEELIKKKWLLKKRYCAIGSYYFPDMDNRDEILDYEEYDNHRLCDLIERANKETFGMWSDYSSFLEVLENKYTEKGIEFDSIALDYDICLFFPTEDIDFEDGELSPFSQPLEEDIVSIRPIHYYAYNNGKLLNSLGDYNTHELDDVFDFPSQRYVFYHKFINGLKKEGYDVTLPESYDELKKLFVEGKLQPGKPGVINNLDKKKNKKR